MFPSVNYWKPGHHSLEMWSEFPCLPCSSYTFSRIANARHGYPSYGIALALIPVAKWKSTYYASAQCDLTAISPRARRHRSLHPLSILDLVLPSQARVSETEKEQSDRLIVNTRLPGHFAVVLFRSCSGGGPLTCPHFIPISESSCQQGWQGWGRWQGCRKADCSVMDG
jgi:hypothetical protein